MLCRQLTSNRDKLVIGAVIVAISLSIAPSVRGADRDIDLDGNLANGEESRVVTRVLQTFPVEVENVIHNNTNGTSFTFKWPGAGPGGFGSYVTAGPDVGTKWEWSTISQVYSIESPVSFVPARGLAVVGAPPNGFQVVGSGNGTFVVPGKSTSPSQVTPSSTSLTSSLVTFFSPEQTLATCEGFFAPGVFEQTITNSSGETITFTVEQQDCCPEPQMTLCDDGCRSYLTDPNNCGGCDRVCSEGAVCVGGRCQDVEGFTYQDSMSFSTLGEAVDRTETSPVRTRRGRVAAGNLHVQDHEPRASRRLSRHGMDDGVRPRAPWNLSTPVASSGFGTDGTGVCAGVLETPSGPVSASHGPWNQGVDNTIDITLGDVPTGFDITDGTYAGWCIEDNHRPNPPAGTQVTLYDTTCDVSALPSTYQAVPWDKVNYLLNHKQGTISEIQAALWVLTWGSSGTFPVTAAAQAMVDDANANGGGFEPGPGHDVAVALFGDGLGLTGYQDTIIQVPNFPDDAPVCDLEVIEQVLEDGESLTLCRSGAIVGKEVFTTATVKMSGQTVGKGPCAQIVPDMDAVIPPFLPAPASVVMLDESGDGQCQPGETCEMFISVQNLGTAAFLNAVGTASTPPDEFNPEPVSFSVDTSDYPDFPAFTGAGDCDTPAQLDPKTNLMGFVFTLPYEQEGDVGRVFNVSFEGDLGTDSPVDMPIVIGIGSRCDPVTDIDGETYDRLIGFESPVNADLVPEGSPVNFSTKTFNRGSTVPLKLKLGCGPVILDSTGIDPSPEIVTLVHETLGPHSLLGINGDNNANPDDPFFSCGSSGCDYQFRTEPLEPGAYVIGVRMPDSRVFEAGFTLRP